MADFRALCAELLEALESTSAADMDDWPDLRARARAALAQPEPVGPTDEEIDALVLNEEADTKPTGQED